MRHDSLTIFKTLKVSCDAIITIKHILRECADSVEVRKKYFEERSLYSLFQNANAEKCFDFLQETGTFYRVCDVLK